MGARAAHGAALASAMGGYRIETKPWDEQPYPETDAPDPIDGGRDAAGRIRTSAAAQALAKLPRRGRYLPREIVAHESFQPYELRRRDYIEGRRAELRDAWGPLSRGVSAMLYAESWLWAGTEFCAEMGAQSGEIDYFKSSATLSAQAKQLAAAAWELAARESARARELRTVGDTLEDRVLGPHMTEPDADTDAS